MNEERLKKELMEKGYNTEEIDLILGEHHYVETFLSPMGEDRKDLGVRTSDVNDKDRRISSVMLGYNKQGIVLPNGELVLLDELQEALISSVTLDDENKFLICKKTGKKVDVDTLVKAVVEKTRDAGAIIYSESDMKLNQDVKDVEIRGAGMTETKKQGIAMLGNNKIKLPCGEYVSFEEMIKALKEYAIVTPSFPEPLEQPEQKLESEKENEKYFVTVRRKTLIPMLGLAMSVIMILTSFGIKFDEKKVVDFFVRQIEHEQIIEDDNQVLKRIYDEFDVGKQMYMPEGVQFYESSDHAYGGKNNSGFFGSEIRKSGNYKLDRISILYNGKIENVTAEEGKDLYSVLEETAQRLGVDVMDLEVSLHFGSATSGWVNIKDLISDDEYVPRVISEEKITIGEYEGTQDYNGTLTIQTQEGKNVELNVLDINGQEVDNGSVVKGSDGRYYEIVRLQHRTVQGERKIVFDAQDFFTKLAVTTLTTALATHLAKKAKEKIEEEEIIEEAGSEEKGKARITYAPRSEERTNGDKFIYGINGGEEILEGKRMLGQKVETTPQIHEAVQKAKERYEKISFAKRAKEKLKGIQPDWYVILQRLNEGSLSIEEVNDMYKENENEKRRSI